MKEINILNNKIKEKERLQTAYDSDVLKIKDEFNTFVQPMMSKIYPDTYATKYGWHGFRWYDWNG